MAQSTEAKCIIRPQWVKQFKAVCMQFNHTIFYFNDQNVLNIGLLNWTLNVIYKSLIEKKDGLRSAPIQFKATNY